MFFVNGRPCGLPQVAKVFNEVYKSYNLSQSPFIFADVLLDTSTSLSRNRVSILMNQDAYDVNVSPDKRTILLHDQGLLLDSMKVRRRTLFKRHLLTRIGILDRTFRQPAADGATI